MNMNANDIRICFIGDSYVQGTGDDECLGWAGRLCVNARCAGHNVTGYNLGVRRETSRDIAQRWLSECERRLPATTENYVVFSFGVNDATLENGAPRVTEDETLRNLRAILEAAMARYQTIFIGPPAVPDAERNARLAQLSERMLGVAAMAGIASTALFPHLVNDRQWLDEVQNNDGAHPRAAGYARIAALIEASPVWRFGPR
ncbi:MAG TPA: GDSL-type esterase/lipase family protein [Acidiferrobacterales bacterium]|nr:GDSL-type esterase/lipase family protein [Acidiferrobacterales bacterium]